MHTEPAILHICTTTTQPPGGMEHLVANLAHLQARHGRSVHALFPQFDTSAALRELFQNQGVRLEFGPASLRYDRTRSVRHVNSLKSIVHQTPADTIVHLHYPESFLSFYDALAVRLAGRRCVVSFHGISNWPEAGLRKQIATSTASRLCSVLTVNSSAVARAVLAAGVSSRFLQTIPCGVPNSMATQPQSFEARQHLGIADNTFVITAAGRLVPRKRIAAVIEATGQLKDLDKSPVVLLIAGDGPERGSLEALARKFSVPARFLGYQTDMSYIYAASDVFALTAEEEAFGMVYVEAAFHGVPSVAVDSGGVSDIIVNGETGILLPNADVAGLAQTLTALRENREYVLSLGEAARKRARQLFTISTVKDQFDKVYCHVSPTDPYVLPTIQRTPEFYLSPPDREKG